MNVTYRRFSCSQTDVQVVYLVENNLHIGKEDIDKNIEYAKTKSLFEGKLGQTYTFTREVNETIQNVVLVGLGKEEDLNLDAVRKATSKGIRKAKELKATTVFLRLPKVDTLDLEEIIKNTGIAAHLAGYTFNKYKTDADKENDITVSIARCGIKEATPEIDAALQEANEIAKGIILARNLVNEPANVMYPEVLAEEAVKAGKESGFEVEVHGVSKIKELKMEAFYSVAKGSSKEPRLIVMRYFGNPSQKEEVLGLVGKGLTFDTGGYSLKPSAGMGDMKSDMGGAASVIGAMMTISKLKLKVNVVAVVAACENAISGEAYKPGDIIGSMAGKTIEVDNTDAEGRLTLVDAVNYIIEKENAKEVIDLATLTGAALVALGETTTAVVTNNEGFYNELKSASLYTGEKMWELPGFDEYKELIKSDVADLKNTGGRYAGTITAGLFIKAFVQDKPWLHLDIAGTAWTGKNTDLSVKGGTGAPVHTLYELVKRKSK
ncbi:leucyl aminopeptidase [Clostridium sp.]|uniref:leucyl aminopeptidase n=1 Tax=Clostridium sp. TaxID=1506 RepID=UPI00260540AF|nr:leucyl aminopeptidase [Clostridium sp.]